MTSTPATTFQVLSLDGGGVRGIFTAALLTKLEEDTGRPIVDLFDLIVGTSTGGIIALGLGAGLAPREILDFYLSEKHRIFSNALGLRKLRHPFRAKFSPHHLQAALQKIFGEKLLGESRLPLVITAYDLGENDIHLFKTPHHERLTRDHKVPMWAVAMATSAAPTYFPAFELPGDQCRLVDGGVWTNNPAMVGVTEAVSVFEQPLESIRVLSVGTTSSADARRRHLDNGGLLRWVRSPSVVDVLLHGQSAGAFAQVQHLVGRENAFRVDPPAPAELVRLDACDSRDLVGRAAHHSRQFCPMFREKFGGHVAQPYSPLHGPNVGKGTHVVDA